MGTTSVWQVGSTFVNNGNVWRLYASGAQNSLRSYTYDSLNRLSSMADTVTAQPCKGLSWTYDAWGNRTDQSVTSGSCGTFHNAVDAGNRFVGSPYQYDAAGNMIHDASHSYSYDAENRMVSVDGGSSATYVYDAFGRRAKKTVGANTYEYVYDLDGNIGWENLNGVLNRAYVRSNGLLVAEYFEGTAYFMHADHLGSTRLLTRVDQSIRECDDYYPYGEANSCGVTTGTTLKFTGDERDAETNLDHTWFRQNSSTLGRWMTPDPAGLAVADLSNPQSWNRYAYVLNNPLAYKDPLGLECVWDDGSFDSIDDPQSGNPGGCGFFSGLKDKFLDFLARNANYLPGVCTAGAFGFGTGGVGNANGGAEFGGLVDKQIGKPATVQPLGEVSYGPVGVGGTPSEALVFVQPAPKVPAGFVFAANPQNGFINNSGISIGFFAGKFGHGKGLAGGAGGGAYLTFSSAANCVKNF